MKYKVENCKTTVVQDYNNANYNGFVHALCAHTCKTENRVVSRSVRSMVKTKETQRVPNA